VSADRAAELDGLPGAPASGTFVVGVGVEYVLVGMAAPALLLAAITAVVRLPFNVLQFAGVLVTYAERRALAYAARHGDGGRLTSATLAAELDAPLPAPRL
jgi:hypothetical protein